MTADDIVDLAAVPKKDVLAAIYYFEHMGMVTTDPDTGAWRVTNWDARQFDSDKVSERTRRHRSNHPPNGHEGTFQRRSTERANVVPRNGEGTVVGTMTESESESESENSSSSSSTHDSAREAVEEDDDIRESALNIVADQRISRLSKPQSVVNAPGYRRSVLASARNDHRDTLDQLDLAKFDTADQLARYLEPNLWAHAKPAVTDPTEATATAAKALRERANIDCPDCESTGWTNADPTQGKCQTCRKLCPI